MALFSISYSGVGHKMGHYTGIEYILLLIKGVEMIGILDNKIK